MWACTHSLHLRLPLRLVLLRLARRRARRPTAPLAHSPIPRKHVLRCRIKRNKDGPANRVHPCYELYSEDGVLLMVARKRSAPRMRVRVLAAADAAVILAGPPGRASRRPTTS